ncbi:cysteine-rich KTR domain-containing protein [Anaerocolumna sp. AGMB13025]|nr:cysteine-rich KTR domain-containing protein [Anaerocolumna sp. AGMB13025]WFR57056.1 cysteine-rich KTR domain-containing protein [Anaerocolumna sp. AGMB13025]
MGCVWDKREWVICPICENKTRIRVRVIKEPDAKTQSR